MQNWQLLRDQKISPDTFILRSQIIDLIREWFKQEGFLEVETPLMVKHPGMEPHLDLFSSEFISKDQKTTDKRYLHTSPEYAMKKLLGAGFEKIFQITKAFRNAEIGDQHNPEFTMLEFYRSNADYQDIISDTENLIKFIVNSLELSDHQLSSFNAQQTWQKLSIREAFQQYADLDLDKLRDINQLSTAVQKKGYELKTDYDWDDLFFLIMLNEIEPKLGFDKPIFLYDYPASQAALAKKNNHTCEASGVASPCKGLAVRGSEEPSGSRRGVRDCEAFWAERFELYINGVELCNAFSELIDPIEQRQRLEEEQALRKKLGKDAYDIDEAFLEALKTMPPSGGNALGIDRLVMVLLGKKSIEEVLLFPWE